MKAINKGIFTKKEGMTQIFNEKGDLIPITVLTVLENVIVQKKTKDADGYDALKIGYNEMKESKAIKPLLGMHKAVNRVFKNYQELRLSNLEIANVGESMPLSQFSENEIVHAIGTSKGRGFTGTVKRYNFTIGPITHGSKHHRRKGTSGAGTGQSKVFRGQKTAGHHGDAQITVKNIQVFKIVADKNIILVRGSVPGANGSLVKLFN
jgi:large subunit ribosomal protein L3